MKYQIYRGETMRHKELKDHIRLKNVSKIVRVIKGKRVPIDGLEASRIASEYLNLCTHKIINK